MIDKQVLFIEDGDITEQVYRLKTVLRKQGVTLVETIFDLSEEGYRIVDPDNPSQTILDIEAIKRRLKEGVMNQRFDYVMCDFDFNDNYLNGFKLIKWLKNVSESEKFKL